MFNYFKYLFLIHCIFMSLFSSSAFSFNRDKLNTIYNEKIINKPTGIYTANEYTFFVVRQECLSTKKFAGTIESKAAYKKFIKLLNDELVNRNLKLNLKESNVPKIMEDSVVSVISSQYKSSTLITHQLLFDRNDKNVNCGREYIVITKDVDLNSNHILLAKPIIDDAIIKVLSDALKNKKFTLLSDYLNALNIHDIADIYLNVNQEPHLIEKTISYPVSRVNPYDINGVLTKVLTSAVPLPYKSIQPNKELSKIFINRALDNFKKGIEPEQIIFDATLSINADPSFAAGWKILSDIYRSLDHQSHSYTTAKQYLLNDPSNLNGWVYMLVTNKHLLKEDVNYRRSIIKDLAKSHHLSNWAINQI